MISKDKQQSQSTSIRQQAGDKHEQSVAFFLRREFKNTQDIYIFNDLYLQFEGETAQIDHLILYCYGFILIESKSIIGEVKVNAQGEWSRSYKGQWSGMASPIKQVQLQQQLLKDLLKENRSEVLSKMLFNKLQQGFGGRSWDQLCAISSNAIIERDQASKEIQSKMVKAEFLVEACLKIMRLPTSLLKSAVNIMDARPRFFKKDYKSIEQFLLDNDKNSRQTNSQSGNTKTAKVNKSAQEAAIENQTIVKPKTKPTAAKKLLSSETQNSRLKTNQAFDTTSQVKSVKQALVSIQCKSCANKKDLQANWGKFGYYVTCTQCQSNTSMKLPCPSCASKKVKNRKLKQQYFLLCLECEVEREVCVS